MTRVFGSFCNQSHKIHSIPQVFTGSFGDHLRLKIICGPFWGSFEVSGSFVVGDHLRYCTRLMKKKKLEILQKVREILFFPDQDLGRGRDKYLLKYYLVLCMVQFYLLPSPLGQV